MTMGGENISSPPTLDWRIIMETKAIEISHYSYTYPGANSPTLTDINLTVDKGEFVILIGPSGCGKSTLIQSLNGIIPHIKGGDVHGEILVNGKLVAEHRVQEMAANIGLVFQDPESQLCNLFISDEVAFGPENILLSKEEILERVQESLGYVGLSDASWKYVYEISGGQQQRLAISSVLALEPEILAFDDPTANLDPVGTAEIVEVLRKMKSDQRTIIIATPWLDEFITMATKLVVLDKEGRIFACGQPNEILTKYGKMLLEEMGVWIPQIPELEIKLQEKKIIPAETVSLTVDESLNKLKNLDFHSPSSSIQKDNNPETIVSVNRVSFSYPDGTRALKGVSFDIQKAKLTAILGPNGSGKSTIAKLMIGLLPLSEGDIRICDFDLKKNKTSDITKKVGFVFQNPEHQFVQDTVLDEITYSLKVIGYKEDEIQQKAEEMISLFELEEHRDRHPYVLSGGQKRRLSVATMLVGQPELLILDEPTYAQDFRNVSSLMSVIKQQMSKGVSVVMITHNMRIVQDYADDVIVISHGNLIYQGKPEKLWLSDDYTTDATLKQPPLQRLMEELRKLSLEIPDEVRTVNQFVDCIGGGN
jgi:energy-coupling factor transport system ATP-binding protein